MIAFLLVTKYQVVWSKVRSQPLGTSISKELGMIESVTPAPGLGVALVQTPPLEKFAKHLPLPREDLDHSHGLFRNTWSSGFACHSVEFLRPREDTTIFRVGLCPQPPLSRKKLE